MGSTALSTFVTGRLALGPSPARGGFKSSRRLPESSIAPSRISAPVPPGVAFPAVIAHGNETLIPAIMPT
jgi:hypothetical protein